jgi:hypothetical protein
MHLPFNEVEPPVSDDPEMTFLLLIFSRPLAVIA